MNYSTLTKEQIIERIHNNTIGFSKIPIDLFDDKDIILELVKKQVFSLRFASERLKNNKEVVLFAVKKNGEALQYASNKLKSDKEIILELVKQDGFALRFISEKLKNNKEIVIKFIKKNSLSLQFASQRLQNNKELLEILEKNAFNNNWSTDNKEWYRERIEFLAYIRGKEEKELMENSIIESNKSSKKIKF